MRQSLFARRPVRSLMTLEDVDVALTADGPSLAVDVKPTELEVWFAAHPENDAPGDLCVAAGGRYGRFTARGWASYAARTFVTREDKKRSQVASSEAILRLLQGTNATTANTVLKDWHRRMLDEKVRVVVRRNTNEVRLVATPSYELYENKTFWHDAVEMGTKAGFDGFKVQNVLVDEDLFSVRIVRPIESKTFANLFFGLELLNSENGSSSTRASFILFDLKCTNGMFIDLGSLSVFRKIHMHWDSDEVREELREAVSLVEPNKKSVVDTVRALSEKTIEKDEVGHTLETYRQKYGASEEFAVQVSTNWETRQPATTWGLLSAITQVAQGYALATRREHEVNAGRFAKIILEAA